MWKSEPAEPIGPELYELGLRERIEARQNVEFQGALASYFFLMAPQVLLSLVTLGLYYPWAQIKMRRYFWSQTRILGEPLIVGFTWAWASFSCPIAIGAS